MNSVRVLMLYALAALAGCHGDSGTSIPAAPSPHISIPVPVRKGPTAEEMTKGMVDAASVGKSQLPVELKFDLRQRPLIGRPLDVDVAVLPQIDAVEADLEVGGDGLSVAPGRGHIPLAAVEQGHVYRQSIKVTPGVEGVLLLSLTVSLKHDETTESRVFSVPLIVEH